MEKVELVHGKRYRGTIELNWFESMASNEDIASKFLELGFMDVSVTGDGSVRFGEGTWLGQDTAIELPSQITSVELIV